MRQYLGNEDRRVAGQNKHGDCLKSTQNQPVRYLYTSEERFRLVQLGNRGGAFYCKDVITGSRTSLKTKSRTEPERLVLHKNEALRHPLLNRKIGMAYLAGRLNLMHQQSCLVFTLDNQR